MLLHCFVSNDESNDIDRYISRVAYMYMYIKLWHVQTWIIVLVTAHVFPMQLIHKPWYQPIRPTFLTAQRFLV